MKKTLIVTTFAFCFASNAYAACDRTPYVAPEELQPACVEIVPDVSVDSKEKLDLPKQDERHLEKETSKMKQSDCMPTLKVPQQMRLE